MVTLKIEGKASVAMDARLGWDRKTMPSVQPSSASRWGSSKGGDAKWRPETETNGASVSSR